ncbi:MAG: AMP-binding protein [Deltaproteobacteria bacterium]|nr:AMP-binding protein [Deltaproteobacteria bacterium]
MATIFREIIRFLLWLRYRVTIHGINNIAERGEKGILFLPNHPALIDPIILSVYLHQKFRPRPIADEAQINRPVIRQLAESVHVLSIPDMVTAGAKGGDTIKTVLRTAISALGEGDNILLYPAGHLAHGRYEDIGANSAVETILNTLPDTRVVLVRTKGLWGSRFGHGGETPVKLDNVLFKACKSLLLNGIFFGPRRKVMIELYEPEDLPRGDRRAAINSYLESFYNMDAPPCTYVPYTIWEKGGTRVLPEPERKKIDGDISSVPAATRKTVIKYLKKITGIDKISNNLRLAHDMGMDSLARAELIVWIGREFGFAQSDSDSMQTVADCLLAASGHAISSGSKSLKPVPRKWFKKNNDNGIAMVPEGDKITDVFLNQFYKNPGSIVIADQTGGAKTYRRIVTGILALQSEIRNLAGARIGIMLPASAGASIVYMASRFAGKIPVMINWTVGERSLKHCLNLSEVKHVLTSKVLTSNIESLGISLKSIKEKFVFLEDMGAGLTKLQKISALLKSYFFRGALRKADVSDTAVILFTSGSEDLPKAVPLTDNNILTNIRDMIKGLSLTNKDILIGMLPPFHSFGLTGTLVIPLCTGMRAVYHPNPTEAVTLSSIIEAYKVNILVGTPTFLNGIARAAKPSQLSSLKLAFSGAEKCPESVYDALNHSCPQLKVLEGYGITECSPVVSCNHPENPKHGTIGRVVESLDYAIIDTKTEQRVAVGARGMLLVRGRSIFNGYLNYNGASPFVDFEGKSWYKTGDLVKEDADGILTFCGRLKRFIKLGGEMISLPAIENVLSACFSTKEDEGPVLAIEATPDDEHPEIVLFTTRDLARSLVNQTIRNSGLSPLHNIRRLVKVDSIPVLGTGKTDYLRLKEQL